MTEPVVGRNEPTDWSSFSFLARRACARKRTRYAELSCLRPAVRPVELGHRLIDKREAGRPPDVVSRRQEAGSLVPNTSLELQQTADHPCWGGTLARALFDRLMNHGRRLLRKETAISKHSASLSPSA